jgi:hypothetical protein
MQYGYPKKRRIWFQRNSCEKSCQRKNGVLTFVNVCKSFRLFWMNIFAFFNGFELSIEFCVLFYPLRILLSKQIIFSLFWQVLPILNPNADEMAQKNEKRIF